MIRDSEQNDLIDQNTREMIEGVMEIAELRVRDIMIPRSQIIFIEDQQDLNTCLNTIIESAHSRFPVIADADDRDNIVGIFARKRFIKILREDAEAFDLSSLLRPVVIVPESKRVDRMLKDSSPLSVSIWPLWWMNLVQCRGACYYEDIFGTNCWRY